MLLAHSHIMTLGLPFFRKVFIGESVQAIYALQFQILLLSGEVLGILLVVRGLEALFVL